MLQFLHAFASLVWVPVGITSSITAGFEKYKSIVQKKNKKHDKIALLGKDKLNTIEVLISKALISSYISHDELVSVNNILREYYKIKEEITNPESSVEYIT